MALAEKGVIKCIVAQGCAEYTRKEVDALTEFAKEQGAKGLATLALSAEGIKGTAQKFIKPEEVEAIKETNGANTGDLVLFVADSKPIAHKTLAALRLLFRDRLEPGGQRCAGLCLGGRLPNVRVEGRRKEMGCSPPSIYHAQDGRPSQIRIQIHR